MPDLADDRPPLGGDIRVTVLVPCFNAAPYLPATLASFDAQTDQRFRVVLVDDGSTDGTWACITDYASRRDGVVTLHRDQNMGVCRSLNEGLASVETELTIVFGADDVMLPDLVEVTVATIDRLSPAVAAVAFPYMIGDEWGQPTRDDRGALRVEMPPASLVGVEPPGLLPALASVNRFAASALLRTSVLRSLGWDESLEIEDWRLWCRLATAHRIGVTDRAVFVYRDTPGSLDKRLRRSGKRLVESARIRAALVGDGGPIDAAVAARTRLELNILLSNGHRAQAYEVLEVLAAAGIPDRFRVQRALLRLPSWIGRRVTALPQRLRRLVRR
jgi:glycosyltransferase involved in cell wall biosynthesis